jgi:hypothetical protein
VLVKSQQTSNARKEIWDKYRRNLVIQTRSEVFWWKKRLQTLNLYVQDDPLHANICLLHLAIRRLVAHHVQESPESLVGPWLKATSNRAHKEASEACQQDFPDFPVHGELPVAAQPNAVNKYLRAEGHLGRKGSTFAGVSSTKILRTGFV